MAKDPAFLFYSSDFNTGTQFMTDEQLGKYIRLLVAQHQHGHLTEKHMMHICKTYDKDVFCKFIKDDEGLYYNERLENETIKRKKYSASRANNRTGKKNTSSTYVPHMENENTSSINDKYNTDNGQEKSANNYSPLFSKMMQVYLSAFPKYFREDERDFNACMIIASKTEKLKGWHTDACSNGKMGEFLEFWVELVGYVKADDKWLATRSLSDLSNAREWQRLGQHMSKPIEDRAKSSVYTGRSRKSEKDDMSPYERELFEKREAAKNWKEQ